MGDHSKKKSFLFKERDELKRQEFLSRLESIPFEKGFGLGKKWSVLKDVRPEAIVFMARDQGKLRHSRTTVIAAYRQKKTEAPFRFRGHTNTAVFNTGVEGCLVPVLEGEDWVILDNLAFHKSPQTRKAIERKAHTFSFFLLTRLISTTLNTFGQPSKPESERTNINIQSFSTIAISI